MIATSTEPTGKNDAIASITRDTTIDQPALATN